MVQSGLRCFENWCIINNEILLAVNHLQSAQKCSGLSVHTLADRVWHLKNRGCPKTSCLAHLMETVRERQRVLDNLSCSSTICRQQPSVSDLRSSAVLASLLFVQFQYELTSEKEDFRGLSASQIPHTVYGIRSAFICCPGSFLLFPIWNFQIGTSELLPRTANIW